MPELTAPPIEDFPKLEEILTKMHDEGCLLFKYHLPHHRKVYWYCNPTGSVHSVTKVSIPHCQKIVELNYAVKTRKPNNISDYIEEAYKISNIGIAALNYLRDKHNYIVNASEAPIVARLPEVEVHTLSSLPLPLLRTIVSRGIKGYSDDLRAQIRDLEEQVLNRGIELEALEQFEALFVKNS